MKKSIRSVLLLLAASCWAGGFLSGCVEKTSGSRRIRELTYMVLGEEEIPEELLLLINERKAEAFRLTYGDQGSLYIVEGYGARDTSGFTVEVSSIWETEQAVCFQTTLTGPAAGEGLEETVTYPYVAVKLEYIDKNVVFN